MNLHFHCTLRMPMVTAGLSTAAIEPMGDVPSITVILVFDLLTLEILKLWTQIFPTKPGIFEGRRN